MAENEGLDLSRVVSIIMENPKLIEEISALAKGNLESDREKKQIEESSPLTPASKDVASAATTYTEPRPKGNRRGDLLGAMKPYLSKERAKAIDSMLSIVEILDMMKER